MEGWWRRAAGTHRHARSEHSRAIERAKLPHGQVRLQLRWFVRQLQHPFANTSTTSAAATVPVFVTVTA
jgi:hypothetical protein